MENLLYYIPGIVLIGGLLAVIKLRKAKKERQAMIIGIGIGVFLVGYGGFLTHKLGLLKGLSGQKALAHRYEFDRAGAICLGRELTGKCLGTKILIISKGDYRTDEKQMVWINNLTRELEVITKEVAVDYPDYSEEEKKKAQELAQKVFSSSHFNELLSKHWYCDLMVSLIGMPKDPENMKIWAMDKKKRPALVVVTDDTNIAKLREPIERGLLSILICPTPGADSSDGAVAPEDPKEAFQQRYLMINADNIGAIAQKHENLFRDPDEKTDTPGAKDGKQP